MLTIPLQQQYWPLPTITVKLSGFPSSRLELGPKETTFELDLGEESFYGLRSIVSGKAPSSPLNVNTRWLARRADLILLLLDFDPLAARRGPRLTRFFSVPESRSTL